MFTKTFLAIGALSALAVATPTPAYLARRACTTVVPDILQVFSESDPTTVFPNTVNTDNSFTVSTAAGQTSRVYQGVGFTDLPPVSDGPCTLAFNFPPAASISQFGSLQLNVSTIARGNSAAIVPNTYSYNDILTPGAIDIGLFGTVGPFYPGQTVVVNSEACPSDASNGGGSLAFLFGVASWVGGDASVSFTEYVNKLNGDGLTGVYLTYGC